MKVYEYTKVDDGIYRVDCKISGSIVGYVAKHGRRWGVVVKQAPGIRPTTYAWLSSRRYPTRYYAASQATDIDCHNALVAAHNAELPR